MPWASRGPGGQMRPQRATERKRRRFRVTFGSETSFTTDLSAGGLCLETTAELPTGTALQGVIEASGKKVPFQGRVVWAVPGDAALKVRGRMGVAFVDVDPEVLELLSDRYDEE
jgi:Tfp pilus assembly protein PilZ